MLDVYCPHCLEGGGSGDLAAALSVLMEQTGGFRSCVIRSQRCNK